MTSLVKGCITSCAAVRPKTTSPNATDKVEPWYTGFAVMNSCVPQSCSVMTVLIAKSTKRRVKYPAVAVFKAVSDIPLRAPCVDVKYSDMVRPSLKFEIIGTSIIEPSGFCIIPRIPANC